MRGSQELARQWRSNAAERVTADASLLMTTIAQQIGSASGRRGSTGSTPVTVTGGWRCVVGSGPRHPLTNRGSPQSTVLEGSALEEPLAELVATQQPTGTHRQGVHQHHGRRLRERQNHDRWAHLELHVHHSCGCTVRYVHDERTIPGGQRLARGTRLLQQSPMAR